MQQPTFTWTELLPSHLIQSVCDLCTRRVAVSGRRELLYAMERVHATRHACPVETCPDRPPNPSRPHR